MDGGGFHGNRHRGIPPRRCYDGRRWGRDRGDDRRDRDRRGDGGRWNGGGRPLHEIDRVGAGGGEGRGNGDGKGGGRGRDDDAGRRPANEPSAKRPKPIEHGATKPSAGAASKPAPVASQASEAKPTAAAASASPDADEPVASEEECKREYVASLREMDQDTTYVPRQAFQLKEGRNGRAQRDDAARRALKTLETMTRPPNGRGGTSSMYDDESDSDEEVYDPRMVLTGEHRRFILALPSCLPVDSGFNVVSLRTDDDRYCFCPCGPCLGPWREKHNLSFSRCKATVFRPNDLMDHLKQEGGVYEMKCRKTKRVTNVPLRDIAHHGTRLYLQYLYEDWHGKGFGHKALFPRMTDPFKKAENEERRIIAHECEVGRAELRKQKEKNKKLQKRLKQQEGKMKNLEKISKDQVEMIKRLETERKKLNVEEKKEPELTGSQVARWKRMTECYFATLKKSNSKANSVKITVMGKSGGDSGFSLQDFFDGLYDATEKGGGDAYKILFGDDHKQITNRVLTDWEIIYEKEETYENTKEAKKQKKRDTGKDEGGPSRQFVADVFKQLDSLCVRAGEKRVKLFKNSEIGLNPLEDDFLSRRIIRGVGDNKKKKEKLIKRAAAFLRAIGRIMFHSFSHGHTLPHSAIGTFFMKVCLQGYDEDYHRHDVLKDVRFSPIAHSYYLETPDMRDDDGNMWNEDTIFSKLIPKLYIHSRKVLLGGLIDGLTLGGKPDARDNLEEGCDLAGMLKIIPYEAIQKIWLSKPEVRWEDLKDVLEPRYKILEDDTWQGTEDERQSLHDEQVQFYNGSFQKYLREKDGQDRTFLQRFVECATGYNYLPYDLSKNEDEGDTDTFKIKIEFNCGLDPTGFPNFHTCTKETVIPGIWHEMFVDDYDGFCYKMDTAIDQAYNQFNME